MLEWLRTPAAIVFVFGVVIFVHELGHFIAAKLMGVYAPRFSIGFGPALLSHKWGETEYILAALPLGGYVRMASREDESMAFLEGGSETPTEGDAATSAGANGAPAILSEQQKPRYYDPNAMAPFGPKPVPEHRWLESKSLLARLFIMLAGVTMNFLLGFFIIAGVFITAGEVVHQTREIGDIAGVSATDSAFHTLAAGDTILSVDGHAVESWNDISERISTDSDATLVIRTNRGTTTIPVQDSGAHSRVAIGGAVLRPFLPAVIGQVVSGRAGDRAGIRVDDSVAAVNGVPVRGWFGLVRQIESSPGKTLTLSILRGGSAQEVKVTPDSTPDVNPITQRDTVLGKIGVGIKDLGTHHPIPFGDAIKGAWLTTWGNAGLIVQTLHRLMTGHQSVKGLAGPVGVGVQAGQAAQQGWQSLLLLLALLSINLAVVNLVPIPILDGGQILIMIAESIKGHPLASRTRVLLFYSGFAAIVLLFSIVTFNDITMLVKRIFHL
ncbi:MAG: RIP metalloprotease RseP [Gemmatimonadaceae bacterium]